MKSHRLHGLLAAVWAAGCILRISRQFVDARRTEPQPSFQEGSIACRSALRGLPPHRQCPRGPHLDYRPVPSCLKVRLEPSGLIHARPDLHQDCDNEPLHPGRDANLPQDEKFR
eukprot:4825420-Heterocapsa_arctica.AAC.1